MKEDKKAVIHLLSDYLLSLSKIKYIKIPLLTITQWNKITLFAADRDTEQQHSKKQSGLELHVFSSGSLHRGSTYQMGHTFRTLDPYLMFADRGDENTWATLAACQTTCTKSIHVSSKKK